jgi:pyruvate/2-oxoglutarate dehydrogenase complex dihydrolipoamide acyltransferase (E2) component
MAAMLRGVVHVLAWTLATGAATTLSWWGVHTVMAGPASDPPRALPVVSAEPTAAPDEPPATSASTRRPEPSKSTPSATRRPDPAPSRSPAARPSASASAPATASGRVRSYTTEGGRAVFDLGERSATLVSATPGAGWSMQVWKTETWIRVEFGSGAERVSVFCTWHDGPPRVDIGTY